MTDPLNASTQLDTPHNVLGREGVDEDIADVAVEADDGSVEEPFDPVEAERLKNLPIPDNDEDQ